MSVADLPLLLALLPLVVLSGSCSATETALFSLTHADRVRLRRTHPDTAHRVAVLLAEPRMLLISVLLLNMTVNVTYFVISSVVVGRMETPLAAATASVGTLLAIILFGEVLPKLLATAHRIGFCRVVARPLLTVFVALGPLRVFLDRLVIGPLARLIRPPRAAAAPAASAEELEALLTLSAEQGAIEVQEQQLLSEVVDFGNVRVQEVMTPRVDVVWLDVAADEEEVLGAVRRCGDSEIPVVRGSPDEEVLGFLDPKRYFAARARSSPASVSIAEFVEPAAYVPEKSRLDQLLDYFRRTGRRTALCVNEFGAIEGVVKIGDVVGRLVPAATDGEEPDHGLRAVGPGRWIVPGRLSVAAMTDFFFGRQRAGRWADRRVSTVGGLVLLSLGRVPRVGDTVRIGNVEFRVVSMAGRTIREVEVAVDPEAAAVPAGSAAS